MNLRVPRFLSRRETPAPTIPAAPAGPVATVVRIDPAYRVARLTARDLLDMSDPIAVLGDAVAMAEECQATAAPGETYRVVAA